MLAERGSCLQFVAAGMCCFCSCKSVQVFELCAVIATGSSFEAASCSTLFLIARMGAAQSSDGGSQPGTTAKAAAALPPIQLSLQLPPYLFQAAAPPSAATTAPPQFPPAHGFPPQAPAETVFRPPLRASMGMAPGPSMGMAPGPSMHARAEYGHARAEYGPARAEYGHARANYGHARAKYGRDARAGRRAAAVQPVRAADVLEGVDLPQ